MPGIVGIYDKSGSGCDRPRIAKMVQSLLYEDTLVYSARFFEDLGLSCAIVSFPGHFSAKTPVQSSTGGATLLFSGENLVDSGNPDDPACILANYDDSGISSLRDLNGFYSGLIIDEHEQRTLLFNDRLSVMRVYYHENEHYVYFASEAKALLAILPECRELDTAGVADYINYDCVLSYRTLFRDIHVMPGASCWVFRKGKIEKNRYFDPEEWEEQETVDLATAMKDVGERFHQVLPRYVRSSVPPSMALTGGLDTRMILSCKPARPRCLPCFTFGSMYGDSLDVQIARRVAAAAQQKHQVIRLDNAFLSDFDSHARRGAYITDGLAHLGNLDAVYLNRRARRIAPVKITGSYGSQVVRGLVGLRPRCPEMKLIHPSFVPHIRSSMESYRELRSGNALSFFLFSEIPWFWSSFKAGEFSQIGVRCPFLDYDFLQTLYRAPGDFQSLPDFQARFIRASSPELACIMTDQGALGGQSRVDRVRRVFYRISCIADKTYSWDKVPMNLTHVVPKVDKYLLTPLGINRLMLGSTYFRYYRTWFQKELRDWVLSMSYDPLTLSRPYWTPDTVRRFTDLHVGNHANYLLELRKIFSLELIERELIRNIDDTIGRNPVPDFGRHVEARLQSVIQ